MVDPLQRVRGVVGVEVEAHADGHLPGAPQLEDALVIVVGDPAPDALDDAGQPGGVEVAHGLAEALDLVLERRRRESRLGEPHAGEGAHDAGEVAVRVLLEHAALGIGRGAGDPAGLDPRRVHLRDDVQRLHVHGMVGGDTV